MDFQNLTPSKTNMAPQNWEPLEKEIHIGNHPLLGSMLVFRGVMCEVIKG